MSFAHLGHLHGSIKEVPRGFKLFFKKNSQPCLPSLTAFMVGSYALIVYQIRYYGDDHAVSV